MARDSSAPVRAKAGSISLWRRISEALIGDIERGALKGGARLPTDIELAERFDCNKHTARRAIAHLEQEGMVRVEWGRGTFVVERLTDQRQGAQPLLTQNVLDEHRNLRCKVLRVESLPATDVIATALRVTVGSPCMLVVLLSEAGDVPLSLGFNYFPLKRLPLLAQAVERFPKETQFASFEELMRTAGIKSHRRSRIRIGARLPTAEEAAQLRMARQQPLLETQSVDVDGAKHPVLYASTCFRADRLQFVVPSP